MSKGLQVQFQVRTATSQKVPSQKVPVKRSQSKGLQKSNVNVRDKSKLDANTTRLVVHTPFSLWFLD